jgi:hypothetical protein
LAQPLAIFTGIFKAASHQHSDQREGIKSPIKRVVNLKPLIKIRLTCRLRDAGIDLIGIIAAGARPLFNPIGKPI